MQLLNVAQVTTSGFETALWGIVDQVRLAQKLIMEDKGTTVDCIMACRALSVAEGELAKAGERIAEYQNANRDLTTQAVESRQQLQVLPSQ